MSVISDNKFVVYRLREFKSEAGKVPFKRWLDSQHQQVQKSVLARLARLEQGNLGDCKSLGQGLFELRIHSGSGWRVYFCFGYQPQTAVLLLGGTKRTQDQDIERARRYLYEYKKAKN